MLADVPAWSRQGLTGGAEGVQKGNCYFAHTWVLVTEKCNGRFSIKIIDFLQFPAEKWDLTDKQTCAKEIGFSPCLHPSPSKKKKKESSEWKHWQVGLSFCQEGSKILNYLAEKKETLICCHALSPGLLKGLSPICYLLPLGWLRHLPSIVPGQEKAQGMGYSISQ